MKNGNWKHLVAIVAFVAGIVGVTLLFETRADHDRDFLLTQETSVRIEQKIDKLLFFHLNRDSEMMDRAAKINAAMVINRAWVDAMHLAKVPEDQWHIQPLVLLESIKKYAVSVQADNEPIRLYGVYHAKAANNTITEAVQIFLTEAHEFLHAAYTRLAFHNPSFMLDHPDEDAWVDALLPLSKELPD